MLSSYGGTDDARGEIRLVDIFQDVAEHADLHGSDDLGGFMILDQPQHLRVWQVLLDECTQRFHVVIIYIDVLKDDIDLVSVR